MARRKCQVNIDSENEEKGLKKKGGLWIAHDETRVRNTLAFRQS